MKIDELDRQLEECMRSYASMVTKEVEDLQKMNNDMRSYFLPQILDELNRNAFYMFGDFKHNIIQYLKEGEKHG